ncbi:MAG: flagellar hook-length control protein FliK [Ruminococcus sp.]|nr:flagellar hook-length control protein FliK [Ruminococcus sp.]
MDNAVLGMAIASMSGFSNGFLSDGSNTAVTGESFGDVLSNVSLKNPADVVNSQPVKDMLTQMYSGEESSSLFDLLKAVGDIQLDDKAKEVLSKLFEDISDEDFDPEEIVLKLLKGDESLSESDLPEEWAGMSLDDSKKLLKIMDLMLYAASDKKPYGEKGVESIFDILFDDSEDEEKLPEMAAASGNVVGDTMFWQTMALSVTAKYTESNVDSEITPVDNTESINYAANIPDITENVSQTAAEKILENTENVSQTAANIPEITENVSQTAANVPETTESVPQAAEKLPEKEMITLPKTERGDVPEMPKTEFVERLTRLSEALRAEISEKIGDVTESKIPAEEGISQADRDKMNVFAVKRVNVSFAAGEIEALTGAETAAPDITEIADDTHFSDISAQIERVMKAEMAAIPEKNTVRELNIRLTPDELGEINVKLTTDGEKLTVAFTAENSSTAKLLSDNIRSLAAAISRNDAETETAYLIQAADGSEGASLNLSAGSSNSFGRGEPRNNGGQTVYRSSSSETDEPAQETILIREAKLWQTV